MSPQREREGGPPSKPIYYISLFSSQQGEGGGVINSEKWADVIYGWPLHTNQTQHHNGLIPFLPKIDVLFFFLIIDNSREQFWLMITVIKYSTYFISVLLWRMIIIAINNWWDHVWNLFRNAVWCCLLVIYNQIILFLDSFWLFYHCVLSPAT